MTMLELNLRRTILTSKCTVGELTIKGLVPTWVTLEDVDRDLNKDGDLADGGEQKVWGQTCIPAGTYNIVWRHSPSLHKMMPYLEDVPGFSGIMIHPGNRTADTKGCLLVGNKLEKLTEDLYEIRNSVASWNQIAHLFEEKNSGGLRYKSGVITISYADRGSNLGGERSHSTT